MYLICGEALLDVFVGGDDGSGMRMVARPGGSPFNVSLGLARLGRSVAFLGGLSGDPFGRRLAKLLAAEGVCLDYVINKPRPTTLSLVDRGEWGLPSYTFYGDAGADRMIEPTDLPALPDDIDLLHFGSYTTVTEPVASSLLGWARRERGHRMISLDPNVRPTVEPNMLRWRSALDAWLPLLDIVKASDEDFKLLYPDLGEAEVARRLVDGGASLVVVTKGAAGALVVTREHVVEVPGRRVQVVDTVGAGDSFQATLLDAVPDRGSLQRLVGCREALAGAMHRAVLASSMTCTRPGADPPRREEVDVLFAQAAQRGADVIATQPGGRRLSGGPLAGE